MGGRLEPTVAYSRVRHNKALQRRACEADRPLERLVCQAGPAAINAPGRGLARLSQRERTEVREKLRVYDPSP